MVELHHTSLLKANWPPLNRLVCLSHCTGYPGSGIVSNCFLSTRIKTISNRRVKASHDNLHSQSLRELQAAFSQIMDDCVQHVRTKFSCLKKQILRFPEFLIAIVCFFVYSRRFGLCTDQKTAFFTLTPNSYVVCSS